MTGGAAGRNQEALQARLVGLAPVDLEAVPAPVAPHRGGVSLERLAFAATGTHGVAVAPARRQPLGIVRREFDDSKTKAVGQVGGGLEIRFTPHVGWTNDVSWNVISGSNNNFGMARTGINFAF